MTFWKTVGAVIVAQVITAVTMSILYVGFAAVVISELATKPMPKIPL